MSVNALSLGQALKGPLVTLYGHPVLGLDVNSEAAELTGTGLGFASIVGFRIGGLACTHLSRPVLIPLPGKGQPLERPECGFHPGEVLKWNLPGGTQLVALTPTHGEAGSLLQSLAASASHECECKGGPAGAGLAGSALQSPIVQEFNACVSVTIQNGQVCLNVPIFGSICIPIPLPFPNGTAAEACIDLCKRFGIPCGVKVTVSVLGQIVASKGFGCC